MSGLVRIAACVVVIIIGLWLFGGLLLRAGGALSLAAGLLMAASTGSLAAAVVAALDGIAWLSGHWLFAVRNHYFRSPLARRVFLTALLRSLDPTRGWGLPNVPPEHRADELVTDRGRREIPVRRASVKVTPLAMYG